MKIETCPVCGSPIEHIELTTLPPIPIKQCLACGWRWEGKQEAVEYVTFKDETDIKVKKAIDLLSEKRNLTRKLQEGWKNAEYCPPEGTVGSAGLFYNQHKEYANALDLAITALRSMPQAGEPLSLEQLREMDGKPVWVEYTGGFPTSQWRVVKFQEEEKIVTFTDDRYEITRDYGRVWLAYFYPPAHIDRSKWEACGNCKKACWNCKHNLFCCEGNDKECDDCVNQSKWEWGGYQRYCSKCGRPLTEEAWTELEWRLRMSEPPDKAKNPLDETADTHEHSGLMEE